MKCCKEKEGLAACCIFKSISCFGYFFLKLFFIYIIIFCFASSIEGRLYSDFSEQTFLDPTVSFENNWIPVTETNGNSFLESSPIRCGQKASFSVDVNYKNRTNIRFRWKKIGTNAELICCFKDSNGQQSCTPYEGHDWIPARITVPAGKHTITWQLAVGECKSDIVQGSVVSIDDLDIPDSIPEINCEIHADANAVIGQDSIASVPFLGPDTTYNWRISSGGIIKSQKPYTNKIIWRATEVGATEISVDINNRNGTCSNNIRCIVSERETINVYDNMSLNELINSSENKILLLNDGNYTDEIIIRVKNIKLISKNLSGAVFHVRHADYSIVIDNTSEVVIYGLNFTDCKGGLIIYNSTNCAIVNNTINSMMKPGIYMDLSSSNLIRNNIFKFSTEDEDQAIRLNNSKDNIIENNSIITDDYLFLVDLLSTNNTFTHDFNKFSGKVFNFDDKTNCTMNCNLSGRHKLLCNEHQENMHGCPNCISCDKIATKINWVCI